MKNKSWRCRFGIHKFVYRWTEDNHRYMRCRRCGKDHMGRSSTELDRYIPPGAAGVG